jgi:NADPH-dependent glutamate synthase beta subunit-like oxidoreductase
MSFIRCTSVFDDQKRFQPTYDESESTEMEFDNLVWAVGQVVEPTLAAYLKNEFGCDGLISVDGETMEVSSRPGVFAGGDIVRGAGTVVEAVADGRRAAMAIAAWLMK